MAEGPEVGSGKFGNGTEERIPSTLEFTRDKDTMNIPPSPPPACEGETASQTGQNAHRKAKKTSLEFWDICQTIARELPAKDIHEERSLQVIKMITYVVLFSMMLFCAVSHKISLMVLASSQFDRQQNRTVTQSKEDSLIAAGRHMLMTVAIILPYCLIFLSSMLKVMLGNFGVPRLATFIVCIVVEIIHTTGLCILCFLLLPELDMTRGIMLLNGVAVMPSFLLPICASMPKVHGVACKIPTKWTKIRNYIISILAILVQWGYVPFILLTNYFLEDSTTDSSDFEIGLCIVSLIFISIGYWENFVDDRYFGLSPTRTCLEDFILSVKYDLQESRPVMTFCVSLFKIGFTVLYSWLFKDFLAANINSSDRNIARITLSEIAEHIGNLPIKLHVAILILTITAFVGYYVGYTACKLQMQRAVFTTPLIAATPLAVLITALDCTGALSLNAFSKDRRACPSDDAYEERFYHYIVGLVVWASIYWICRHVFYPNNERLTKLERLFLTPYYCGILFEQHLILNRRRHNRKIYKEKKEHNTTYILSSYDTTTNKDDQEVEMSPENVKKTMKPNKANSEVVPMIYACATMWHETKLEMMQLLKSLFRLDRDQWQRSHADVEDDDIYDFEAHILFDDAMELNDDNEMVPNQFVKILMSVIDDAVSSVYERRKTLKAPDKVPTPYGGQLIWEMPGGNFLYLHMKDTNKIRHRKRWSQVMYMYYLLGFRIMRHCQATVAEAVNKGNINDLRKWLGEEGLGIGSGRGQIFQLFDASVNRKMSNTFLLALDGDVDFTPGAVRLLVDRMRRSDKVGAACGRIHPIGTGPVVWFQKFEYAIAHWLQKATEHVLGCVLCSPGCFSMFRGSALMDDNVMKRYTVLPTEAVHHLMYDQGEDRWLCTLLLQQGYRVDYAAGSDAFTHAPEGFAEFFNQRRRWMPSTIANIIDLLTDYTNTVYVNSNINILYIFYQAALLVSTILGPATILMMIAGASLVVFKVSLYQAYLIAILPALFYCIVCFFIKTKHQLLVAQILTAFYTFVMLIVLVGTIVTAAQESPYNPSVIFMVFLVALFGVAAILHPKEWTCVVFGILYFLLIPTGFLLLTIYSICNMHIISWGTREVQKKKKTQELAKEKQKQEEKKKKKQEQGILGRFFGQSPSKELKELLGAFMEKQSAKEDKGEDSVTTSILKDINATLHRLVDHLDDPKKPAERETTEDKEQVQEGVQTPISTPTGDTTQAVSTNEAVRQSVETPGSNRDTAENTECTPKQHRDDLKNPAWSECKELGKGSIIEMGGPELKFWQDFIAKYLQPLELTKDQKKANQKSLIDLRNNMCLGMAMINVLWIAINFMFQLNSPTKINLPIPNQSTHEQHIEADDAASDEIDNITKVDILGLLFIIFYVVILLLQFIGMLLHRWDTFLHLVAVTELRNPLKSSITEASESTNRSKELRKDIDTPDAYSLDDWEMVSYHSEDESVDDTARERWKQIECLQNIGARLPVGDEMLEPGASPRFLRNSAIGEKWMETVQGVRQRNKQTTPSFVTSDMVDSGETKPPRTPRKQRKACLNLKPGYSGLEELINPERLSCSTNEVLGQSLDNDRRKPEGENISEEASQSSGQPGMDLEAHNVVPEVHVSYTYEVQGGRL